MTTLLVNNTDLMSPEWRFIEPQWTDPRARWEFFHGVPQNWLERNIKPFYLARYRAALQAVRCARMYQSDSILISHLPSMTAATNILRQHICPKVRHVAFAFNFTDLPTGPRMSYFRRALQGVDEYVVFSQAERKIYATAFDIAYDKFHMLHWAMDVPKPGPTNPVPFDAPYLCAIGGEGRDYSLLARVMRDRPDLKMVIVARPYSISGITFPDNVCVFTNLPSPETWRLARDSKGLVVPLKTATTACGHITIVGAQLLNIPLVVTRSSGVADYVGDDTATLIAPGNVSELSDALGMLVAGRDIVQTRTTRALAQAQEKASLDNWHRYFQSLLD